MAHKRVAGHDSLFKDPVTGLVINNNREAFLAAKAAKRNASRVLELENRLERLERLLLKENKDG